MREENERQIKKLEAELNNARVLKTAGIAYKDYLTEVFMEADQDPTLPNLPKKLSDEMNYAVEKGFESIKKCERRQRWAKRKRKIAVCFVVSFMALSTLALSVRASRANIANYLISTFTEFAEIHYDKDQNAQPPVGWFSDYYPTWLPEDFKILEISFEAQADIIRYQDGVKHEIAFIVMDAEQQPSVDTENMMVEPVSLQGYKAQLFASTDRRTHTLVLPLDDHVIIISGEISKEAIMLIGDHVKIN